MAHLGHFSLVLAWLLALIGLLAGLVSFRKQSTAWLLTARNATILCCLFTSIATVVLGFLFADDDYTNQYVWSFSDRSMTWWYKVSAIWGGMDGSMLLWCFILSIMCAVVAIRYHRYPLNLIPIALAGVNSSLLFFLTITTYVTNPFRFLEAPFIPPDGNGLNPLLQNPYMAIHPPMLYLGFTTFTVPYAFCMAALATGTRTNEWLRATRHWTLLAWMFLTVGIALGGHWAYLELGWGGFWAWDPVENASFLPWLTATAYVHSVMVQERKGMLRYWNVWLIVITYALTVFGTFLTRSGVVQSVHAFASTDVGWAFLLYLAILLAITGWLVWIRRNVLTSERKLESVLSREAAFLMNNLLFCSICFAVLWGVLFPVFSEWVTGTKQTVSIPYFNTVTVPMFLLLIFLMGVGPLIAWRRARWPNIKKSFLMPFTLGCVASGALVFSGITSFYAVLSYGLCVFVTVTVIIELHRGISARRRSEQISAVAAGASLLRNHRTRYGGYLIHLGVVVATIGITASMAHKLEQEFTLERGQSITVRRFSLSLQDVNQHRNSAYDSLRAVVQVSAANDSSVKGTLNPEMRFYHRKRENTSEVALRMGPLEDLYLVLAGLSEDGKRASFKVFVNPLQAWLWVGILIIVLGTLIVLVPQRMDEAAAAA